MEGLRSSSAPLYQRIADRLRDQITSGELAPGQQLPTEHLLAETWGVARQTVRNGIAVLVGEGLVEARRPQGHFVRSRASMIYRPQSESLEQPASPEMDRFCRQITEEGRIPSQTIEVSLVRAPQDIAQRLEVDDGAVLVARLRVRSIDGEPVNINDSYYPLEIVKDSEIMSPADVPQGTNQVLADLGFPQDRAIDEVLVRMPTPEQIRRLELGPGTPVAVHYVTGYTADGRPVRCTVNVLPGDRHRIMFERRFELRWS